MQMTASDFAYIKGEGAARPGDTADKALVRAAEHGYLVPSARRDAFVAGFVANCQGNCVEDSLLLTARDLSPDHESHLAECLSNDIQFG